MTFAGTEFTTTGLVSGDSVTRVTLTSDGAAATAGVLTSPYAIVASQAVGSGLENYRIGYVSGQLSVTGRTLTITAGHWQKTYGEAVAFAGTEMTVVGLINGDTVTRVTLTSEGAPAAATVAGSPYAIAAAGAVGSGLANYSIRYVPGTMNVVARALSVTAAVAKTYGTALTFAGTEFTADGLVNGDAITRVSLSSGGAAATATVAGSPYAITVGHAVGTGLANYSIRYVTGTLTVGVRNLTIVARNQTKTYGQRVTLRGTEFTADGLVNGDTITSVFLSSGGAAATATVAGSPYAIAISDASGTGLDNYRITYVGGVLNVDAKTLTITADNRVKTYDDVVTFAGTEFTAAGLIDGDRVTGVTLASAGAARDAAVGHSPYAIRASGATGTGLANYAIVYVDGALAIERGSVMFGLATNQLGEVTTGGALATSVNRLWIRAVNLRKMYGEALTFAGTEFTVEGQLDSDRVTSVTLTSPGAEETAPVGGYPIIASNAVVSGAADYTIDYVVGWLIVSARPLTITAADRTKVYGDAVAFDGAEFHAEGLVNDDAVTSVTLASEGAAAGVAVTTEPYAIVARNAVGTGLGNYSISYVDGALTVTPRALSLTGLEVRDTTADGGTRATIASYGTLTGLLDDEEDVTLDTTDARASFDTAAAGSGLVVTVTGLTLTGAGAGNYSISDQTTVASSARSSRRR